MKSDIQIPEVKGVYVAVIREWDKEMLAQHWFAYVVNDRVVAIEMVLVVTKGYDKERKTSTLRHNLGTIASKSARKIEMVPEEVLVMNNAFVITFFSEGKMYDKTYLFEENTINNRALQFVPILDQEGVVVN